MTNDQTELSALLYAEGANPVERLDHWAQVAGDRPFIHYGEDDLTLTFAEFGRLTDHIAGNLAAHGVLAGDRISVFTPNPLAACLVMFGAWKMGALFCPVNFNYRGAPLAYQLNDTAPVLLITDPSLVPAVNEVADELDTHPLVSVYAAAAGAHDHVAEPPATSSVFGSVPWSGLVAASRRPAHVIAASDPCNVIYTSGTTGSPKGVVQPFGWMAQYTYTMRAALTPDDVIYNDLPMYHVAAAIANVARAAWVGCEIAMWDRFSPAEFWDRVASRGATTAILIDVMVPWLMWQPPGEDDHVNSLNKVLMLPLPGDYDKFTSRWGIDFIMTGFGQTESGAPLAVVIEAFAEGEATPADLYRGHSHAELRAICERFGVPMLGPGGHVPKGIMGAPIRQLEVAVLDEDDLRCPVGVPGELAVRPLLPDLVMKEYLGKPGPTLTAWRNLWLHTGDVAMLNEDGTYVFVDRMGDRLRVRGENLSSSQVEQMLNAQPGVAFSTVFPVKSGVGSEDDIVAFIVLDSGAELTESDIEDFARETMPKFMRPRHVRIVADVPRTPTMKIEKYKLRDAILRDLTGQE